MKCACVFGGTGFVGRYIVKSLVEKGYVVKVPTRTPQSGYFLKVYGEVGQVVPIYCDGSGKSINEMVKDCEIVVNTIGILASSRRSSFRKIHIALPMKIAKASKKHDVEHFVQISALSCDKSKSRYACSKYAGEQEILKIYQKTTILRPSIIFGAEDSFFNRFKKFPILPLIGGGKTKFQPVYVGDIAKSVLASLDTKGGIYELGGPDILTFKALLKKMNAVTKCNRPTIYVPFVVAYIQGLILGCLPGKLLTVDQVRSLKTDNIVDEGAKTLIDLGIKPVSLDSILPRYL